MTARRDTWRLLAVHAHPDDESITTGGTLAHYAAQRDCEVTVVTCTLGEEGEVIPDDLRGLESAQANQLGGYRLTEVRDACAALGVTSHHYLGGLGAYRDSGMIGTPPAGHPRAFVRAAAGGPDHDRAVADLVRILEAARPHVLLTYEADGGYGHPDHMTAHDVAVQAGKKAGVPRILAVGRLRETAENAVHGYESPDGYRSAGVSDLGYLLPSVDATIDVSGQADVRNKALARHVTQVTVLPGGFALSNNVAQPLGPEESYRLLVGVLFPDGGIASDLFAGLPV